MVSNSKPLLLVLSGMALALWYGLRQVRPPAPRPYQGPAARVKPLRLLKPLGWRKPRPEPTQAKPPAPKSRPPQAAPLFFAFEQEQASPAPTAWGRAQVYGPQKVYPAGSVILKLEEALPWQGQLLPKGTLLYGTVRFAKQRVLISLHTARYEAQVQAVQLTGYDTDYTPGLHHPQASPWEQPQDRLAGQALGHTAGVLREISSLALHTWQQWKRQKAIDLRDKRPVFVACPNHPPA